MPDPSTPRLPEGAVERLAQSLYADGGWGDKWPNEVTAPVLAVYRNRARRGLTAALRLEDPETVELKTRLIEANRRWCMERTFDPENSDQDEWDDAWAGEMLRALLDRQEARRNG